MKPDTRSFYEAAVQRAIEQIAAGLDDALDLESLARSACLSAFHFHRVFRGMTGETPLELSRRLRLERAAWTLANTADAVTGVALDAGYDTHEAFTRAFRGCYRTSPSGFRSRRYARIELVAPCGVHYNQSGTVPAFIPRNSGGASMDVTIRNMPAMRVAAVRHRGPYNQIPQAFEKLGAIAHGAGLVGSSRAMIALYHDDPDSTPPDDLRSDAGLVVPEDVALPAGIVEQHIPAGRYAQTVHLGPYETLGDTWARFMGEWLPASGERIGSGASYEIYLNTPGQVLPSDLKTELYISLA